MYQFFSLILNLSKASKDNTSLYFFPETPVLDKNCATTKTGQRRTLQDAREDFRAMLENDIESSGIKSPTTKLGPNFILNDIFLIF